MGTAAKVAAVLHVARLGLAKRYPWTCLALTVDAAKSSYLMYIWYTFGVRAYGAAWSKWHWITIATLAILCAESVHVMSRHFKAAGIYKVLFLIGFVGLGALAAVGSSPYATPAWKGPGMVLLLRSFSAGCAVSLLAGKAIYGSWAKLRLNADWHWRGMLALVGIECAGAAIVRLAANHQPMDGFGHIVLRMAPLVAVAMWSRLRRNGEEWSAPAASAEAGTRIHAAAADLIKREVDRQQWR